MPNPAKPPSKFLRLTADHRSFESSQLPSNSERITVEEGSRQLYLHMNRALPISLAEYRSYLHRLWPTSPLPRRLGIALSGGIDSMALAYLTSKSLLSPEPHLQTVHVFVVDHGARPESSSEAAAVAEIARRDYGFDAHVLPLALGLTKNGFETRARAARYRALARACVQHRVGHLLLAHHADDQAETVMLRLAMGCGLEGLGGMRAVAGLPECADVSGARGVVLWRPFLGVGKARLKATCEQNSIPWFEDSTNKDTTYTRRNSVRKLLTATPPRLPRALQAPSLLSLSQRAEAWNKSTRGRAQRLLNEACEIVLDRSTGSLHIELPDTDSGDIDSRVFCRLLADAAQLVSPLPHVGSRDVLAPSTHILRSPQPATAKFTAAGLKWTHQGGRRWLLERQPYSPHSRALAHITLTGPGWSEWRLWDGRWWIRINTPPTPTPPLPPPGPSVFVVRPLEKTDMKAVRGKAERLGKSRDLERVLKLLKGPARFVIPAIFKKNGDTDEEKEEEEILALPTVNLALLCNDDHRRTPELEWEVKFKEDPKWATLQHDTSKLHPGRHIPHQETATNHDTYNTQDETSTNSPTHPPGIHSAS